MYRAPVSTVNLSLFLLGSNSGEFFLEVHWIALKTGLEDKYNLALTVYFAGVDKVLFKHQLTGKFGEIAQLNSAKKEYRAGNAEFLLI